ncbi:MAG: nitroreductase, partial [Spirochaetota bacterium]|nr:nitroreductase [Spirochaetota bacterium]
VVAKVCGIQLYQSLGIAKDDTDSRINQWIANFRAFDAPVALYFFLDSVMGTGSYLDYGMYLQSLMLAAVEEGLASCPQAALGQYPAIVKDKLGYPVESILICGMALGYEDTDAAVNGYRTSREKTDSYTRYFD